MGNTFIKICCISSVEEANMAIEAGASAIGLVGQMPSGPGIISDDLIAEITASVPNGIETFLLTSETKANNIIAHHSKVKTSTIQIVDALTQGTHKQIKTALPNINIIQVLHVLNKESVAEAIEIAKYVDGLLLDSGNPNLFTKELGGTGRTHDWEVSKKIVEKVNVPVILAGGIHPSNARKAIKEVRPYGLDLCSGVRTHGNLDKQKLISFFKAVNT